MIVLSSQCSENCETGMAQEFLYSPDARLLTSAVIMSRHQRTWKASPAMLMAQLTLAAKKSIADGKGRAVCPSSVHDQCGSRWLRL